MDERKYFKEVKIWGFFLIILQAITFFLVIISDTALKGYSIFGALLAIVLIILFWIFSNKKSIVGPILGIILGALYIISRDIISLVIGISLIVDCARFIKYLKS